jgi:hypothetical protein
MIRFGPRVSVAGAVCVALALALPAVSADSPPAITNISAFATKLVIRLVDAPDPLRIVELRAYETSSPGGVGTVVWEGRPVGREVTVARFREGRDRLYAKFQIAHRTQGQAVGSPHWVDDLEALPAWGFAMPWPQSKKGVSCPVDLEDLKALGARYADDGVVLAGVFDWSGEKPRETWEVDGQKLPINVYYIRELDRRVKRMTELGINVTLIAVNGVPAKPDPANPLIHPRTDLARTPNHLGAFNLTDERGLRYYRAAFEYLAHRYSDPSGEHGWVSGYVVGNELQSHWAWHNMGRVSPEEVTREYADQLRVAWLAVRRFHSGVRIYASMDHTWATHLDPDSMKSMAGDQFLERLNQTVISGGNFPWNVAFHPYPEDLFEPRFWKDQTAGMGFDSPRITFKNLELLPAFLAQKQFLYQGRLRRIILSEQGFHCPDGPDGEKVQAAACAYAYYKVSHMPAIDAFILHRHVDHRDQGGLRLGLWTRKLDGPDPCAPDRKRMMWDVLRWADTEKWEQASEFAKPIIGITDWREALPYTGPIPKVCGLFAPQVDPSSLVYSLRDNMSEAHVADCIDWRPSWAKGPDGLLYPAIFQHPPDPKDGVGEAAFSVPLPKLAAGRRLVLKFGTVLTGPSYDGVKMSVLVGDRELWSAAQTVMGRPRADVVDLTAYAGQSIQLTLRVDALANTGADWANWLQPLVVVAPGQK